MTLAVWLVNLSDWMFDWTLAVRFVHLSDRKEDLESSEMILDLRCLESRLDWWFMDIAT